MFIGHLPAGYCLTSAILKSSLGREAKSYRSLLYLGLITSVLPDVDILYFYWIDNRQHLHHSYWTHIPFFWIMLALALSMGGWLVRSRRVAIGALIGLANIVAHLLLDSIASKIQWFAPISFAAHGMFHVPSRYGWWVWNYIGHWTFAFEVMLVMMAGYMLYYRRCVILRKQCITGPLRP